MSLEDNIRECEGEDCDVDVLWVKIVRKDGTLGGWHPFSTESKETRYVLRKRQGHTVAVPVTTLQSHFADCPNADELRGGDDG